MKTISRTILLASTILAIGMIGSSAISSASQPDDSKMTTSTGKTSAGKFGPITQEDFTRTAEATVNGVVSVKSFATPQVNNSRRYNPYDDFFDDPFFEYFFGGRRRQQPQQQQPQQPQERQLGLGSGVIIDSEGYVVTNNHVIDGADRLEVTLNDNRNYDATVIGSDPTTDLALIKIENAPADLHVIPMGDSDELKVGEWVLAVGNPFGFTSSVTAGVVSAKARDISQGQSQEIQSYIQHDAAVNRGNSGGALVNLAGELVGINAAIYSQTGAYAGCSFAIPTSMVEKVVNDLRQFGTVQRAYMGISYREVTPELVKEKEIVGANSGIYVFSVEEGSAAEKGGIKEGDVIIAINSQPTRTSAELFGQITKYSPGDEIEITVVRNGKMENHKVVMRNRAGNTEVVQQGEFSDLGATFKPLTDEQKKELNLQYGVQVTDIKKDGAMSHAGVKNGYIILDINNVRVNSSKDIETLYKQIVASEEYDHVMFITGIYPGATKKTFVAVPLDR